MRMASRKFCRPLLRIWYPYTACHKKITPRARQCFIRSIPLFIMRNILLIIIAVLLLLPAQALAASQVAPVDGLWLSLPPDSVKCVVVRLPHDAGLPGTGNYMFTVRCTPEPQETWADLSEQLVREVHENNIVVIPICFDTAGPNKPVGNCSTPYTITVSEAYTGVTREWHGGICVSEFADADIVRPDEMPASGDGVRELLNDNTDILSAWLDEEELYAKPGGSALFNLSVQSHAGLDITVLAHGDMDVSPPQASLTTGPGSTLQSQGFEVTAPPGSGTYRLALRVSTDTCQGRSYCTKLLEADLVVSEDEPPERTGFEVVLRPGNIDIKEPEGVIMRLTIVNNERDARGFRSSINIDPDDGQSGFMGESVDVGAHDSHTRIFIVTPGSSSKLYEVTATVASGGVTSSATSFITIDELVTDALRQAGDLGADSQAAVNSWRSSHAASEYGSDLHEYGSLRETLASAREQQEQNQSGDDWMGDYIKQYQNQTSGEENPYQGMLWIVLVVVLVAAAALAGFMFLRKRGSGDGEEESGVEYY